MPKLGLKSIEQVMPKLASLKERLAKTLDKAQQYGLTEPEEYAEAMQKEQELESVFQNLGIWQSKQRT